MKLLTANLRKRIRACLVFAFSSILLLFILSCNRSMPDAIIDHKLSKNEAVNVVSAWMEKQITTTKNQNKKKALIAIRDNVDFTNLWQEDFRARKKFIIVPLKAGFTIKANKNKPATSYLLAKLNENNTIEQGEIIQYYQSGNNNQNPMPKGAIHEMYNSGHPTGVFSHIDLDYPDYVSAQNVFKNDKLVSATLMKPRANTSAANKNDQQVCFAWYEVITTFDEDGNIIDYQETYLFTSCSGGGNDPNGGGGNNNGDNPTGIDDDADDSSSANDLATWKVGQAESKLWTVWSTETVKGWKHSGHPSRNTFTSIEHNSSDITASGAGNASWKEWGNTVFLMNSSLAKSIISGAVKFTTGVPPITLRERFQIFGANNYFP